MTAPDPSPRSPPPASRVAWASIAVTVGLTALNLAIAAASGSLPVAAEMVDNLENWMEAAHAGLTGASLTRLRED